MWNLWKETSFGGIEWSLHQLEVPSSKISYASLVGLLYPLPLVNLIFRIFFSSSVSACQLSNNHGFVYLLLHMEVVFPLALSIMLRPKKKNKEFGKEKGGRGVRENNWLWMLCIKHTHTHKTAKFLLFNHTRYLQILPPVNRLRGYCGLYWCFYWISVMILTYLSRCTAFLVLNLIFLPCELFFLYMEARV